MDEYFESKPTVLLGLKSSKESTDPDELVSLVTALVGLTS